MQDNTVGSIKIIATIDTTQYDRGVRDIENKAKSAGDDVDKGFTSRVRNMQPAFQKMAAVGVASFGALAFGINQAVNSAGEAEKIATNFENTFGESSDVINSFIQDFGDRFAFIESELQDGANSIGFQLNAMGGIGKEAGEEITTSLLTAAGGLSDFFGEQLNVTEASQALAKGLAGNTAQLQDMGFNVAVKDIENMAEAMGFNTDELTKAQKAQALTKLIMDQTKGSVEGLESSLDTFTGQQRAQRKATVEASQALGDAFLPVMQDISETLTPLIEKVGDWIEQNPDLARNVGIATVALTALLAVVGLLGLALPAIATGFGLIFSPIGLIIIAIGALIAVGILLFKNWETIKEVALNVWNSITNVVQTAVLGIIRNLDKMKGVARNIFNFIGGIFSTIGEVASGAFKGAINGVLGFVERTINGFINLINGGIGAINRLPGVNISRIDNISIPRLAEGGIVTSPTFAEIGEGGEPEAVIPLSKLDQMLDRGNDTDTDSRPVVEQTNNIYTELDMNRVNRRLTWELHRA